MKRTRYIFILALLAAGCIGASAQEVNTTNMLEIAPYRHYINPAFEPLTDGYFYIPVLGHLNMYAGQNSFTMGDFIFKQNGVTMTALHPDSKRSIMSAFRPNTLIRTNFSTPLLAFGARTKKDGYWHVALEMNADLGAGLPRDLFRFALGGGMRDLAGLNTFNLKGTFHQIQQIFGNCHAKTGAFYVAIALFINSLKFCK